LERVCIRNKPKGTLKIAVNKGKKYYRRHPLAPVENMVHKVNTRVNSVQAAGTVESDTSPSSSKLQAPEFKRRVCN
jgi:hypothetical protein